MQAVNTTELQSIAKSVRHQVLDLALQAKYAHLGGALSCVEILITLYLGGVMRYDTGDPESEYRDRLILSKGHGSMALYSVLNKAGFISNDELALYHTDGHFLAVHPQKNIAKGIEASGGSLGQGLPFGVGSALALKLKGNAQSRVYVILGDGECNEGSNWEAAAFAAHKGLDNLTVIVDRNHLQSDGATSDILNYEPFADKWKAFGFDVIECNGHDFDALLSALTDETDKPMCIIANTIKGKGVSFMEDNKIWHYNAFTQRQYEEALIEVEADV